MSTEEVEVKARKMGWLPEAEFRGKKEHWIDAEKYVQRGEEFIPFLQADRRRLEGELTEVRGKVSTLENTLKEASETIDALKEFRTAINKERVADLQEDLVQGIKQAREDGDIEKEESLRSKLTEAKESLKEPEKKPEVKAPTPQPDITQLPEWKEFIKDNPWWNDDDVMRAASIEISKKLAAAGELDNLSHAARFAKIAEATKVRFGMEEKRQQSRVEGGKGGGDRMEREHEGEKNFNDLPVDVREASKRFEDRLVGKKKGQFPDLTAYRKHYAEEYFRKNPNG